MKEVKVLTNDYETILSPLENDVLNILWPDKSLRVREIYEKLKGKRKVALTSVAVILDRLHERSIVERKIETARGGLRYLYTPKQTKQEFDAQIIDTAVNKLINQFGNTAVSYFNERFSKRKQP
ncbi:BlaI/MecI/CopY family transcriptional regulator [Candidatus Woesearchaeota archaeon]|nr:BlaI/MecI/CopY family transcriptional regulator [Candidatus Woesearchaeota archaeon]